MVFKEEKNENKTPREAREIFFGKIKPRSQDFYQNFEKIKPYIEKIPDLNLKGGGLLLYPWYTILFRMGNTPTIGVMKLFCQEEQGVGFCFRSLLRF